MSFEIVGVLRLSADVVINEPQTTVIKALEVELQGLLKDVWEGVEEVGGPIFHGTEVKLHLTHNLEL